MAVCIVTVTYDWEIGLQVNVLMKSQYMFRTKIKTIDAHQLMQAQATGLDRIGWDWNQRVPFWASQNFFKA